MFTEIGKKQGRRYNHYREAEITCTHDSITITDGSPAANPVSTYIRVDSVEEAKKLANAFSKIADSMAAKH